MQPVGRSTITAIAVCTVGIDGSALGVDAVSSDSISLFCAAFGGSEAPMNAFVRLKLAVPCLFAPHDSSPTAALDVV